MVKHIVRFMKEEDGATAVEYGLMVALIAVAIVTTVGLIGGQLNTVFLQVNSALTTAASKSIRMRSWLPAFGGKVLNMFQAAVAMFP